MLAHLEQFIRELGNGFSFVARQKRMIIDGEDFYLDLLFYHRRLHRLIAIDLKHSGVRNLCATTSRNRCANGTYEAPDAV